MTQAELAKAIKDKALLKGDFTLRSGQKSSFYFDKYIFESDPQLLEEIGLRLKGLVPSDTEMLAGLEMGGLPLGTVLSLKTGLPVVFVRKKAKEYGTKKITEGLPVQDKKVCVVEDVITTGGQVLKSVQQLENEGAFVEDVLCVIYRGSKDDLKKLEAEGLRLYPLFKSKDLGL